MKGVIFYYSGSGNTELACRSIAENIKNVDFKLINVKTYEIPDLKQYDVVGFAFPTFHMGVPNALIDYIEKIPQQIMKPAFILNTYSMMQGKALKLSSKLLTKKGFTVFAAHILQMPENYPVFISKGWANLDKPDEKQINAFKGFIANLSSRFEGIQRGEELAKHNIKTDLLNSIIPVKSREKIIKELGKLKVDVSVCTKCSLCADECPYNAIDIKDFPVFNSEKCWGCYICFNNCPNMAIYTDSVKSNFQYDGPDEILSEKLTLG